MALLWRFLLTCSALFQGRARTGPAHANHSRQDFSVPDVWRPTLSPDGNYLAFLARGGARLGLAVIDIERRTSSVIATLPDADVVEFHWVIATHRFVSSS